MIKKDITNREEIHSLLEAFYAKIREDDMLGPIFNKIVKDWSSHILRITDFWETNLFNEQTFKGNPLKVHQKVDTEVNNIITQEHFGRWLNIWFQTIDELFEGPVADTAKRRARKMSTFMFLKIFEARK